MDYEFCHVPLSQLTTPYDKKYRDEGLFELFKQTDTYKKEWEEVPTKGGHYQYPIVNSSNVAVVNFTAVFIYRQIIPPNEHSTYTLKCVRPLKEGMNLNELAKIIYL